MIKKWLRDYHFKRMWKYIDKRKDFVNPNKDRRTVQLVVNNEQKIKYHHIRCMELTRELKE